MKMNGNRNRKRNSKRILTALLCWALCSANIISADMIVWASEAPLQESPANEGEDDILDSDGAEQGGEEQESEVPAPEDTTPEESIETETPEEPEEDAFVEEPESDPLPDSEDEAVEEEPEVPMEDAETAGEEKLLSVVPLSDGNIASGAYPEADAEDRIEWVIDQNGKLIVEGVGNLDGMGSFADWCYGSVKDLILTAEIHLKGIRNAQDMFRGCTNLTSVDLRDFDTGEVTTMYGMFEGCENLVSLDISGFDTGNVTDMAGMFEGCENLVSLDVSGFDTGNVTNMSLMFKDCRSLTKLDVTNFDTRNVELMVGMFEGCNGLTALDVSRFQTDKVRDMSFMFSRCSNLTELNVKNFNTKSAADMHCMFQDCSKLTKLDLSNFDTSKVTKMGYMFSRLNGLTEFTDLNLSSFDTSNVVDMGGLFYYTANIKSINLSNFDMSNVEGSIFLPEFFELDKKLETIYTPYNLKQSIPLPKNSSADIWYRADTGDIITELPQGLSHSIMVTKEKKDAVSEAYISVMKAKTVYQRGETINTDDITVIYYGKDGSVKTVKDGFTTNVDEIDTSKVGRQELVVTYEGLKGSITLSITVCLDEETIDVEMKSSTYTGYPIIPALTVTLKGNEEIRLTAGTDYTVSCENNVDAGESAVVVIKGIGDYSGTVRKNFIIEKAKVTIKAADVIITVNDAVPETFDYETAGFFNKDEEKVTGVSFLLADMDGTALENEKIDTSKSGTYQIILKEAQVGANYILDTAGCVPGILSIAEERIAYTVTFDMMGHGTQTAPIRLVRSGSLIEEPEEPVAEGYLFSGWYKDRACTKQWNFNADTVQENTMLYACWVAQTAEGGVRIQEIPDQTYTGSAIKPTVIVYAADGKTLLKSGKDYTVKYYNNIKADQVDAAGGTYNSLDGSGQEGMQNKFDSRLPYVEIKGKGNHEGTVYRNFHIDPAVISDAAGNPAAGFTLKYSDQLVTDTKKEQKPFSSLKYKKVMKTGEKDSDFQVTLSAIEAYDGSDGSGKQITMWTATGNKENKWNPAIPKGYYGTFRMTVEAAGNYRGKITKTIYVSAKNNLLRNAAITLGKNQKNMSYNGGAVTLTPGYYDSTAKKYYRVNEDGSVSSTPEGNGNDLFTVKAGSTYLVYGRDYTVNYVNNTAVGTAAMTLTGKGSYRGSKSVAFKITGKAFKANTIDVKAYKPNDLNPNENDFKASMAYTGSAVTQNKVTLTTKPNAESDAVKLDYGRHYSISYKNNIKKGTATMTFTAKPESGYSGSFKKTFKIGAVSLADDASVAVEAVNGQEGGAYSLAPSKDEKGNKIYELRGAVPYTKEGAKPSGYIALSLLDGKKNPTGVVLKEGTDYTVSYANHTVLPGTPNKIPTMIFKGKGNFAGSLKVIYTISTAELADSNLMVSAAPIAVNVNKAEDYQYEPKITVKDGKKVLGKNDYTVEYKNCSQTKVKEYLDQLKTLGAADTTADAGSTAWAEVRAAGPCAVIKAAGSGYVTTAGKEITVYLNIYETKLTGSNVYVVVSEETAQTTYHGERITPAVAVYYGNAQAVKAAKRDKVTEEEKLTGSSYGLKKLTEKKDAAGDYTLTYGANVAAGKNKGSVTVSGSGLYGGDVTVKFTIRQRNVYQAP